MAEVAEGTWITLASGKKILLPPQPTLPTDEIRRANMWASEGERTAWNKALWERVEQCQQKTAQGVFRSGEEQLNYLMRSARVGTGVSATPTPSVPIVPTQVAIPGFGDDPWSDDEEEEL